MLYQNLICSFTEWSYISTKFVSLLMINKHHGDHANTQRRNVFGAVPTKYLRFQMYADSK